MSKLTQIPNEPILVLRLTAWEEVIGSYRALETDEKEVSVILSLPPKNVKLTFPENSTEAKILRKALAAAPKGRKIGLLRTDLTDKPLMVRILNATTAANERR